MSSTLKFLALLVVVLVILQLANAAPVNGHRGHKHNRTSSKKKFSTKATTTVKTGEHPTQELPEGTPQAHGLATNWTKPAVNRNAIWNNGVSVSNAELQTLQNFARLASTAYCSVGNENGPFNCGSYCDSFPGTTVVKTFKTSVTATIGFVARNDVKKAIYVAFRGSANIQSFIQDAEFLQTNYPPVSGAKVHQGFLESHQEARDIVYNAVVDQMNKYQGYTIYVVGHSLGGALAILQALDFNQRAGYDKSNMVVYTYGEPRVGNPAFSSYADSLSLKYYRTVNQNDIVSHLPPQSFGYKHHATEYWIEDIFGNTVECAVNEDFTCSNSVVPFTSIAAHLLYWK
ncbi:Alpha/Beta hydrolase protein [Jimgerdemannia flammicorona]|uniref:Alpha/Beta hydrolase protein n=1 Tax=Jimgerdemannia flammicorona TaxID=994334 RepID=A0A433QMX4_9FUNG|nr:Alpha/Beta hydrolase protein [Jimgerdemannia flammicorona]